MEYNTHNNIFDCAESFEFLHDSHLEKIDISDIILSANNYRYNIYLWHNKIKITTEKVSSDDYKKSCFDNFMRANSNKFIKASSIYIFDYCYINSKYFYGLKEDYDELEYIEYDNDWKKDGYKGKNYLTIQIEVLGGIYELQTDYEPFEKDTIMKQVDKIISAI